MLRLLEKIKAAKYTILLMIGIVLLFMFTFNAEAAYNLVNEDFNDGIADGWVSPAISSGDFSVVNQEYVGTRTAQVGETLVSVVQGGYDWTDYTYDLKVKASSVQMNVGVVVRSTLDYTNFNALDLENNIQGYVIFTLWDKMYIRKNGLLGPDIATPVVHGFSQDIWYPMRIVMEGSNIKVYVSYDNGISYTLKFDVYDSTYSHGTIGVCQWHDNGIIGKYDDIVVTSKYMIMLKDLGTANAQAILENACYKYTIALSDPLRLLELTNKATGINYVQQTASSRSPFAITIDGVVYDSASFHVDSATVSTVDSSTGKITIQLTSTSGPSLSVKLYLTIKEDSPDLKWDFEMTNIETTSVTEPLISFPLLNGVRIGSDPSQDFYIQPTKGGIINNASLFLNNYYGGHYWMQVLDVYNPGQGGGVYLRVEDNTVVGKLFSVKKINTPGETPPNGPNFRSLGSNVLGSDVGVSMTVHYPLATLPVNGQITLPQTAIGVHSGDFKAAMEAYRTWVNSWYQPRTASPWFKKLWQSDALPQSIDSNYHEHYDSGKYIAGMSSVLDQQGTWIRPDAVNFWGWWQWSNKGPRGEDPGSLPSDTYNFFKTAYANIGIDFDTIKYTRNWNHHFLGDYDYNTEWGGLTNFVTDLNTLKNAGLFTYHYIEGSYLASQSTASIDNGEAWGFKLADGTIQHVYWNEYEANYDMCPYATGWQDYLANTVVRLFNDTGVDGIYLDSVGVVNYGACYNPLHNHTSMADWARGTRDLFKKIRDAVDLNVGTDKLLFSEAISSEVNSQYLNSALDDTIPTVLTVSGGKPINLFRFYFPETKLFVTHPQKPNGLRMSVFNGEGVHRYNNGVVDTSEDKWLLRILKKNGDAFISTNPTPLIQTENAQVIANRFPLTDKTVYTLFNQGDPTVSGTVLRIPHETGYHYFDLLRDLEITPQVSGSDDLIPLSMDGTSLGIVAKLKDVMSITKSGSQLSIQINTSLTNPVLRIYRASLSTTYYDLLNSEKSISVTGNPVVVDLSTLYGTSNGIFTVELLDGTYLVDAESVESGLLLKDDFSGDLSKWVDTTNASVNNGELTVTDNELMRSLDGSNWTDYIFEADVKVTNLSAGLVFRSIDSNNYYMWQLNADVSKLRPHKKVNGAWTVIKEVSTPIALNTKYHVKIEAIGSTIKTYIDGDLVDTATDTDFSSGKVGFREGSGTSETGVFDNVLVVLP